MTASALSPRARPHLGTFWLITWCVGALVAWLLPWAPVDGAAGWPQWLTLMTQGLSFLLRWLAFETTLLTIPVASLSLVLLVLLIIQMQHASWSHPFWRGVLLLLALASGMLWSLAHISDFMRSCSPP